MPLQDYYHSYLIHVSSAITTNSVVADIASSFYQTSFYYRLSLSFQLAVTILSQKLSPNQAWASFPTTATAVPLMHAESFRGYLQGFRAAIRSQPLAKDGPNPFM
jgi:hypothetical protein